MELVIILYFEEFYNLKVVENFALLKRKISFADFT